MKLKAETAKDYQERINKVLVYINNHLSEDLDLRLLAEISNFSPFHFHRIMRAHLGEALGSYIIRIRLEIAARLLEFSQETISDIAWKIGYETPGAFSTAFKNRFGVSPIEFRNSTVKNHIFNHFINKENTMKMELKPKIKEISTRKVIYIQVIEAYGGEKTAKAWEKLWSFVKEKKLYSFGMESLGVSHDDPSITDADKCRYDACVTIKKDVKPEGEIGVKDVEGGKYAIFKHVGPYDNLGEAYNQIYRNWLPASGYELRDVPCFDKYMNNPSKTKAEKLQTYIYIPVK
ncbi:MAG: AraC family transcriptional regulator [Bacteroidetes bacterium]|nr:AraC family transcriptional regulator [Bacteroidota bacterium]